MIFELFNNLSEKNKIKFCNEFAEIMDSDIENVIQFIIDEKIPKEWEDFCLKYLEIATMEENIFTIVDPELLCEMNRKYRDITSLN